MMSMAGQKDGTMLSSPSPQHRGVRKMKVEGFQKGSQSLYKTGRHHLRRSIPSHTIIVPAGIPLLANYNHATTADHKQTYRTGPVAFFLLRGSTRLPYMVFRWPTTSHSLSVWQVSLVNILIQGRSTAVLLPQWKPSFPGPSRLSICRLQ